MLDVTTTAVEDDTLSWILDYCRKVGLDGMDLRNIEFTLRETSVEDLAEAIRRTGGATLATDQNVAEYLEGEIATMQAFQIIRLHSVIRGDWFLY